MKRDFKIRQFFALILGFIFLCAAGPLPAAAFYEWQGKEGYLDLHGMVRAIGIASENPENEYFFKGHSEQDAAGLARLIMQARSGSHLGFEVNVSQAYIPGKLASGLSGLGATRVVERSDALEWSFSNDDYFHTAFDRISVRWSKDSFDLILGRQPINLATTFFFSPNDFFAPFAAQAFYRVYKPGVDAIRAEVRLGDLSQLSLISVLGYCQDPQSDTGWSDHPSSERASYICRISTVFHGFEGSLIGGEVGRENVIGGSLQGEIFKWLGIRAEGHFADPGDAGNHSRSKISVGVEHRWENSLDIRMEHFYNGSGAKAASDYSAVTAAGTGAAYPGRNYLALGAGYEFSPLWTGRMSVILNLEDDSCLCSFNVVHSLSDEAELSFNAGLPFGEDPQGSFVLSEFGMYPYSLNIEVRYFF